MKEIFNLSASAGSDYLSIFHRNEERKAMDVFCPPTTRLALKWASLGVRLLVLLQWGTPTVDAREGVMYGEGLQQQRRSCDPQRLSECREYMEMRREQPSERCCEQLERMSPQCRCRAIQQVLDQSQSYDLFMDSEAALNQRRRRESRGREEAEEAEERAAYLPETCNIRQPPRRCDVQRRSRYFTSGSGF
uniref:Albumin 1 n=1 Tax=Pinus strobus TaxID=3348 RepID=Q40995_PINST|nr:albumin 1 [Pinus strobus]